MVSNAFRVEGGIAGITGGLFLLIGHLVNFSGDPAVGTVAGKSFVLAGHIILVFAFIGFYAQQRLFGTSSIGRTGMILSVFGTILVSAIVFVELAGTTGVNITPVFQAAGTTWLYTIGPLAFVLGMLLVGGSIVRKGRLPKWSGVLLIIGTIVFAGASIAGDLAGLVTVIGAGLTAGGFVWSGAVLLMGDETTNSARVSQRYD